MKKFHPRNKHQERYDFEKLIEGTPELKTFLTTNPKEDQTINFHNPAAVKMLNKALLKSQYQIDNWNIPDGYLCPPVPGRADYVHHLADVLANANRGKVPKGKQVICFDIGVGANCIYPIVGSREYGWSFIGSDIDEKAIKAAKKIVEENSTLKNKIDIRLQSDSNHFFKNVLSTDERVDLTICNPPFHSSLAEAKKGTARKVRNLKSDKKPKAITQNFGGQNHELWCKGGEVAFIKNMIKESKEFATDCFCFSTLVSKKENLKPIENTLKKVGVIDSKIIPMTHGNKNSRVIAWTFLNGKQREIWGNLRWNS